MTCSHFHSDCHEWLCEGCEKAHKRVKMTKEHALLPLTEAEEFLEREKKNAEGGEAGGGDDSAGDAAGNNRGVYCKVSLASSFVVNLPSACKRL